MYAQDSIELLKQSGIDFAQVRLLRCSTGRQQQPCPGGRPRRSPLGRACTLLSCAALLLPRCCTSWLCGDVATQPQCCRLKGDAAGSLTTMPVPARLQNESRGIDVRHFGELLTVSGVVWLLPLRMARTHW